MEHWVGGEEGGGEEVKGERGWVDRRGAGVGPRCV